MGEHHRVVGRLPAAAASYEAGRRPPLRALWACVLVLGAGAAGGSCDRGNADGSEAALPSASARRRNTPVDSTKPGEIAEGTEQAFGFPVPRDMKIKARFPDAIHARGRVAFEPLANYVRERVNAKRVDTGPAKTVFVGATLKSDPKRHVRVEVSTRGGVALLVVRDETRPPAKPGLSEEERWRRLGLTPDGRPRKDLE